MTLKVLVVDDTILFRKVVSEAAAAIPGVEVVGSAANGVIALSRIKSLKPDILTLDLEMPDIYGEDIAGMLKDEPETKTIPVIFLTGMFPKEEERKGGRVVAGHVLFEKPYDILELVTAIEELLSVSGCKSISHKSSEEERLMNTNISVLVIEDEKDVRKVLECRLKSGGFDVYSAADGPTGLKIADEKNPDVILLDWIMPKMNGFETARELRSRLETAVIPIILLTGRQDKESELRGIDAGADDYITKPFDSDKLLARIKMLLRRKER